MNGNLQGVVATLTACMCGASYVLDFLSVVVDGGGEGELGCTEDLSIIKPSISKVTGS